MIHAQVPQIKKCEKLDDFFRAIDDLGISRRTWLFRGQNRDWPLRPSSMRYPFLRRYVVPVYRRFRETVQRRSERQLLAEEKLNLKLYVQRRVEDLTVWRFAEVADRAHLHVPSDSRFELGGEYFRMDADELENAARGNLCPLRLPTSAVDALAQHHGVPTRLLDWTYSPYIAAYFATHIDPKDLAKRRCHNSSDPMVVWAVNYTILELLDSDLRLVVQPRTQIGHLQAQDGVFLYNKTADQEFRQTKRWTPFETKIRGAKALDTYLKLEIPLVHREKLRSRLLQYGISEPKLMPSFDVAAKWTLDFYASHPQGLFVLPQ